MSTSANDTPLVQWRPFRESKWRMRAGGSPDVFVVVEVADQKDLNKLIMDKIQPLTEWGELRRTLLSNSQLYVGTRGERKETALCQGISRWDENCQPQTAKLPKVLG